MFYCTACMYLAPRNYLPADWVCQKFETIQRRFVAYEIALCESISLAYSKTSLHKYHTLFGLLKHPK